MWTEVLRTSCCQRQVTFFDASVQRAPLTLVDEFSCPKCHRALKVSECERVLQTVVDPLTGKKTRQRKRKPTWIYGQTDGWNWSRPATQSDSRLIRRVEGVPVGSSAPRGEIFWGDLYRSGYHAGISHFTHLYTSRNLCVFAALWDRLGDFDPSLRDALKLLLLSYNASHSTLLTRVVVKSGQEDFVVSGAQSGVLYVSGLPVEKNIFAGIRRKIKTFADAFSLLWGCEGAVKVVNGSSTRMNLAGDSVDYVFTDPPFGDFIPYAEVNQVNEAWLSQFTNREDEVIISPAQGKSTSDYERLMRSVFAEVARVLKPESPLTVVFHASKPAVWEALGSSLNANGFGVVKTSVLNKVQVSFKQVVHEGGTRGDAVFLLESHPQPSKKEYPQITPDSIVRTAKAEKDDLTPKRLYSRYVAACLQQGQPVGYTAPDFYAVVGSAE